MVESLAAKLGMRLSKIPEARKPATDWTPVFEALSAAREKLGFGPAHNTGSEAQLKWLRRHTIPDWLRAIESQCDNLGGQLKRNRLTRDEASAYLSLQTISRNFDRCLERATPAKKSYQRLSDGRWVEVSDGQKRVLSPEEIASLNLEQT